MKKSSGQTRWQRVETIFHEVMELPKSERKAGIRRLTSGDQLLASEVESLVRSADASPDFLESRNDLNASLITQILSVWSTQNRSSSSQELDDRSDTQPDSEGSTGGGQRTAVNSKDLQTVNAGGFEKAGKVSFDAAREYLSEYRPELQLIEQVGEGAAGIVVRAYDHRLGREVAVKLLHPAWAARLGENFVEREAQAASLSNDHVVRVYEVAPRESAISFLVLEWISGPSLRSWLTQHSAISPRDAARLVLHVALGLSSAHQRGFIHGDIKPANVMLEPVDGLSGGNRPQQDGRSFDSQKPLVLSRCRAKLADFGLARRLTNSVNTQTGFGQPTSSQPDLTLESNSEDSNSPAKYFMGTPAYASPEQLLDGQQGCVASDIYSVGATLYHALVGTPPFSGRPHAIIRQWNSLEIASPRKLDSRIPKDLESICLKALSRLPEHRYRTARELADDLERFLDGLPVVARPISASRRFVRLIQRRPLISSLFCLLALALVTGAAVSNAFRITAEKNYELASENLRQAAAERDRAKAVVDLLQGMISAADVNYGDRNVKLVDALAGLESRISIELAEMPETEAEVSRTLGNMYFSIADYEKSRFHFQRAMDLRSSHPLSKDLLEDRIGLANALRWLYRQEEALSLSLDNWTNAKSLLGIEAETSLHAGEVLAGCYQDLGRYEEAAATLRTVLEVAASELGEDHERTLLIRSGLAGVFIDSGRYSAAEVELRGIIKLREAMEITSNRETLILGSNLATVLAELGRLDEAIEQQQENVRLSVQLLGQHHDLTITSTLNLAESLRRAGRSEEALDSCKELLEKCSASLGWNNTGTLGALESVVLMLVRSKEHQAALDVLNLAAGELESQLPPDSDWRFRLSSLRAAALSGLGQHDDALPRYVEAIEHYEKRYGRSYLYTLTLLNNYAVALIEGRRPRDAIEVLTKLVAETVGKFDSMHPIALRNLGHAELVNGQMEQAEQTLQKAKELSASRGELSNVEKCEQLLAQCRAAQKNTKIDP